MHTCTCVTESFHCLPKLIGCFADLHNLFTKLWLTLRDPMELARQIPLSMGFSRQEYWSGLPFPSQGDFLDPWVEHGSPAILQYKMKS